MSVKKFKFVSPGVFLNEIDNSQLTRDPEPIGPTVIGRLPKGPGMLPVTVDSMSDFVEIFGNPVPGGVGGDVWREGNYTAPTYAAYAAQAYLRNAGPVNVVRLLGIQDPTATAAGEAGWKLTNTLDASDATAGSKSSVYGLYLFSTGTLDTRKSVTGHNAIAGSGVTREEMIKSERHMTGALAAIWYFDSRGGLVLSGNVAQIGAAPLGVRDAANYHSGSFYLNKTRNGDNAAIGQFAGQAGNSGGDVAATSTEITASHVLIKSTNPAIMEFKARIYENANYKTVTFNFDRNSDNYIRKVFNTNPTLTNADVITTAGKKSYWLGETFDRYVKDIHGKGSANGLDNVAHQGALDADNSLCAVLLPLHKDSSLSLARRIGNQDSVTGWVFSQDINAHSEFKPTTMQKLFRFIGISDGGWNTRNLKISITDIKAGNDVDPYGTFSVLVRRISDNDQKPVVLERFSQCSLNPNSSNYVARKIGDQFRQWDEADDRYRIYGNHPNLSQYFRVEMDQDVDQGVVDPQYVPFGFYGPPRYKTFDFETGRNTEKTGLFAAHFRPRGGSSLSSDPLFDLTATNTFGSPHSDAMHVITGFTAGATGSIQYPTVPLRISSSAEGLSDPKKSFFGASTYRSPSDPKFDPSFVDVTRRLGSPYLPSGIQEASDAGAGSVETSFYFTLDDLMCLHKSGSMLKLGTDQGALAPADVRHAVYVDGSRESGISYTAKRSGYKDLLKSGYGKFTIPVYGGFDGLDITESEPFRNSALSGDETTSSGLATLKRAIDAVSDPEVVEMNALAVPGVNKPRVTNHMIRVCEERADALAVIDIENGGYIPETENTDSFSTRVQNSKVETAITSLEQRGLNSSYACCFFPWVKIGDSINARTLWVPPSVIALGTFANTQANSELWFAPAGFTRGGLTEGAAGIPVLAVSQRLSSKERDRLYETNINPIAQFPAEGIVVFGQKTLQVTPSALDRINVRRLMIFVKKQISRIAARLLFDQNVQATWDRFLGQVEPFLDSVKSRLGITEFRVILDETTTTPDLIDRNIMYAKIFLKPARAIEFIAIDFVITNSGASFED